MDATKANDILRGSMWLLSAVVLTQEQADWAKSYIQARVRTSHV